VPRAYEKRSHTTEGLIKVRLDKTRRLLAMREIALGSLPAVPAQKFSSWQNTSLL
jgi:hypothetical protein